MSRLNRVIGTLKQLTNINDLIVSREPIEDTSYKRVILNNCDYSLYIPKDSTYKTIYNLKYIFEIFFESYLKYKENEDYVKNFHSLIIELLNTPTEYATEGYIEKSSFDFLPGLVNYAIIKDEIVIFNSGIDKFTLDTSILKLKTTDEFNMFVKSGEVFGCCTPYYKLIVSCDFLIDDMIKSALKLRLIFTNKLYENALYLKELETINSKLEETIKLRTSEVMEKNKLLEEEKSKLNKANLKLIELNKQLNELSKIDPLTKLSNRRDLQEKFEYEIKKLKRKQTSLSIIIGDIDFFKKVNDTYGHECGDQVLIKIANIFRENLPSGCVVARYGGEEFVVLLPGTSLKASKVIIEKLRLIIENEPFEYNNITFNITVSFGLYNFKEVYTFTECLERADEALYAAKNSGRNRVVSIVN